MKYGIGDLSPGEHLCCLYQSEDEHCAAVTMFMRRGLEQNHKVLYIVDTHTAETILDYLRATHLDVQALLERGQLIILSQDQAYTRDGLFDPQRMIALLRQETDQALAQGYDALRVTGEMTWALRGAAGSERLIEYERLLNEFLPGSRCLALCQYDRRRFSADVLLDVLRTHPIAVVGDQIYDNFYYTPPRDLLGGDPEQAQLEHWLRSLSEYRTAQDMLNRQASTNAAMAELSQKLIGLTSIEDVSALVLDYARQITGSEFGYVGYIDLQTGHLVSATLTGDIWEACRVQDKKFVFSEFKGLWGWVLEHRQSLLCNDLASDPRSTGIPTGHVTIRRFLSVPALLGERLLGQVALANAPQDYHDQDLFFAERLALLYALSLDRIWSEQAAMARLRREQETWDHLSGHPHTTITARSFGLTPLRESVPQLFEQAVQDFAEMLDAALERQVYKQVEGTRLAQTLTRPRRLAEQLGAMNAGPRDVIDIYMTAWRLRSHAAHPRKAQAYTDEGRLLALELMGYLVSFYHSRVTGLVIRNEIEM